VSTRQPTPTLFLPILRAAEASLELPDGWKRTESRSRPGQTVYENIFSGERQAWFPDTPASDPAMSADDAKKKVRERDIGVWLKTEDSRLME
jgi:hypothetical protein